MKKMIVICSSADFYKDVIEVSNQLTKLGFKVDFPDTAKKMQRKNDFNVRKHKTWFKDPKDYKIKTKLMKDHFKKVVRCDAILVINKTKKGMNGYIGGNTLIEIAIAFNNKIPIYILNSISKKLPYYEEVLGMQPIFIRGDLNKIKSKK